MPGEISTPVPPKRSPKPARGVVDTRRPMSTHQSSKKTATSPAPPGEAVVFGCGLIGGSIAARLRTGPSPVAVFGVDRRGVLDRARARGIVDDGGTARQAWARIAHQPPATIILALPVDAIIDLLPRLSATVSSLPVSRRPLIVDVGSVKSAIVTAASELGCPRFVGGHPMAGLERGGIEHAHADLLEGATFALCPAGSRRSDLQAAKRLVASLGARPLVVDAAVHDRVVATTSHLPHLCAWALMDAARELDDAHDPPRLSRSLAGGSWADATRVAASDPRLWSAILAHNREPVSEALGRLIDRLQRVRDALEAGRDPLSGDDPALPAAELAALARRRDSRRR